MADGDKQEIPAGFGRRPDGSLIPIADMVQGPSDILAQYRQNSIPEDFPEMIERNRVAGLDAKGYPIPGATLSDAAKAVVALEADGRADEATKDQGTAATQPGTAPAAPSEDGESLLQEIEEKLELTGHQAIALIEEAIASIAHREQDVAVQIRAGLSRLRALV